MADQFFGLTDTGKQRSNNEDTFIAQQTADGKMIIACVIDGVGGYTGGEVAADLARTVILQRLNKPSGDLTKIMVECFNQVNQKIIDEKKRVKEHDSMACVATLALIDIERNQFFYAHVGDTRLYLLRDHSLVKISHDQSFVGFLEESNRITEEEAMTHPKRNEINKALGFETDLAKDSGYIEIGQSPFLPGDMLLLCSDGLTDMVAAAEITKIVTNKSSLKDKCNQLIGAANANGGNDNITVVLAKNDKQTLQREATMPLTNKKKSEPLVVTAPVESVEPVDQSHYNSQSMPQKSNSVLTVVLGMLALLFLAGNVWQYLQNKKTVTVVAEAVTVDSASLSPLETQLNKDISGLKGNLLILSDSVYTSPITLSKTIQIARDTLFIKTKGKIAFVADTGYQGAAFTLAQQCKLVMLDSLSFNNFKTGIIAYNNALLLQDISFRNCAIAVQNLFALPDNKLFSGSLQSFKADSIPVNK